MTEQPDFTPPENHWLTKLNRELCEKSGVGKCPFCGGAPWMSGGHRGYWHITCSSCNAVSGLTLTEKDAAGRWNRRAADAHDAAAEIDRLRAELAATNALIAEFDGAATAWRQSARQLVAGLIAIRNAAPTVPASVLRGIAYDIAFNRIDPKTAEFQIGARAAKAASDGDPP